MLPAKPHALKLKWLLAEHWIICDSKSVNAHGLEKEPQQLNRCLWLQVGKPSLIYPTQLLGSLAEVFIWDIKVQKENKQQFWIKQRVQ